MVRRGRGDRYSGASAVSPSRLIALPHELARYRQSGRSLRRVTPTVLWVRGLVDSLKESWACCRPGSRLLDRSSEKGADALGVAFTLFASPIHGAEYSLSFLFIRQGTNAIIALLQ
jgi:hypothetical protein